MTIEELFKKEKFTSIEKITTEFNTLFIESKKPMNAKEAANAIEEILFKLKG